MRADVYEDILIEMSRLEREAMERIRVKMASEQLGEAWVVTDRREVETIKRGTDRRWRKAA